MKKMNMFGGVVDNTNELIREKKYELSDITKPLYGKTLYRIRALRDFSDVKKGDLGGFVESEINLSHEGDCWIYDDAMVFDEAKVSDNAIVMKEAIVSGNSTVRQNAIVSDNAEVTGHADIADNACVVERSRIQDYVSIIGKAVISGEAFIRDKVNVAGEVKVTNYARISGNVKILGNVLITGCAMVSDNVIVFGNAIIGDNVSISGNARIGGNVVISHDAVITNDARITTKRDFIYSDMVQDLYPTPTFFKVSNGGICVASLKYNMSITEYEKYIEETYDAKLLEATKLLIKSVKLQIAY